MAKHLNRAKLQGSGIVLGTKADWPRFAVHGFHVPTRTSVRRHIEGVLIPVE